MLSSSKLENLLVLKYYDPSILLFLTPAYPTAVLSGLYSINCNCTKKTVRIINFQPRNSHTSPFLKQSFILRFQDKVYLESI